MTDLPVNETGPESEEEEEEDEDSGDNEMHLGLPPQEVRRHYRVHSSPPSYQVAQSKSTIEQDTSDLKEGVCLVTTLTINGDTFN